MQDYGLGRIAGLAGGAVIGMRKDIRRQLNKGAGDTVHMVVEAMSIIERQGIVSTLLLLCTRAPRGSMLQLMSSYVQLVSGVIDTGEITVIMRFREETWICC